MGSQTAGHLLAIDRLKSGGYRTTRLYPATAAIINLFFCAFFERYLKNDDAGFYLSVFLLLEIILYTIIASTNFFTVSFEILTKSRIFPTKPADRLRFVILGNFRRPILLSFVVTNLFFLMVLFHDSFWNTLAVGFLFVLMVAVTEVLLTTILLTLVKRSMPLSIAIVVFGSLLISLLIGLFVFHYQTLVASIPLIRWTVNGILAATRGDIAQIAMNSTWLVATALLLGIIGRRLA